MLKRLAVFFATLGAAMFVTNMAAAQDYPVQAPSVSVSGSPGPVGSTFTAQVDDCTAGEDVIIELPANGDGPVTALCTNPTAIAVLDHPPVPGTNTGTAQLVTTGVTLTFTVVTTAADTTPTVPPSTAPPSGSIPATGSDATGLIAIYGGAAIAIGAAMVLVATNRRRSSTA